MKLRLRGTVYNGSTGAPVAGAAFTVDGKVIGRTRRNGSFAIEVASDATVLLERDGFDIVLVDLTAPPGPDGDFDQVMLPLGAAGEIIELTSEVPPAAAGAAKLERTELERLPGTGGDLLAGLKVLPGVVGTSALGAQNGLVIRGSAPEDSRILIDGFDVPLLYHSLAQRSILPTGAVANIEYLPGGFDVAWGRASSGIVAVATRGGSDEVGGHAEVAVIDGGVLGQGPVGESSRVLVAARRSVIDLLLPSVVPDDAELSLTTVPRYYDGQLRLDTKLSSKWRGSLSAIAATDTLELYADDENDPDARFYNDSRFVRVTGTASYYARPYAATIAVSGLAQGFELEIGREQHLQITKYSGASRAEITRTDDEASGLRNVVTRVGAEIDVARNELDLELPRFPDEGEPDSGGPMDRQTATRFVGTVTSPDLGAWAVTSADLDPKVRITGGLRLDGFVRSGDVEVQPRGELAIKLAERSKLRLSSGAYRRPAENRDELLDDTLAPERSIQSVLGFEQSSTRGWKVQASLYYTHRSKLITRTMDDGYANQGRGTTYGAELLATYKTGPWFTWLSYSYAHSTRVDSPGAEERLFDYDQPHTLNVVASWRGKRWQIGGRFQYLSGQPVTPVVGSVFDSDEDQFRALYGSVNSDRLPDHTQLDLRIDRFWKLGDTTLSAFLDVQNVTANAQVSNYTYNFDYTQRYEFTGLPILPSIGVRGEL
ncbi:MAG: TonB-dependent receptor plug domain-containing protein [Kofleriaceae bacterium]|nr:TonB-dependent receptor plug domain-containing protein [Kofleriaceae bacterium]